LKKPVRRRRKEQDVVLYIYIRCNVQKKAGRKPAVAVGTKSIQDGRVESCIVRKERSEKDR
jgi:hypothetical protein